MPEPVAAAKTADSEKTPLDLGFVDLRQIDLLVRERSVLPTIAFHGLSDSTVHPSNGTAVLALALPAMPGLRRTTRHDTSPGGQACQ